MKKISLVVLGIMLPMGAFAENISGLEIANHVDESAEESLVFDIRRIGLEASKTQVRHEGEYQNSPVAALHATSQDVIKGVWDTVLEYTHGRLGWDNSLFMEYGKTTLKPYNEPRTTDESADKILLASDVKYAIWEHYGLKFGPIAGLAYDTQFKDDADNPRMQVVRARGGLSLFDHPIFKSLYVAGVYEYDFTYSDAKTSKSAVEGGWRLEYDVREGVKLSTNGYYREYLSYSEYVGTDLERDFSAVVRMDTNLWGDFTLGPYAQYRRAKARDAEHYGSNFIIGVSFNYITKFGLLN